MRYVCSVLAIVLILVPLTGIASSPGLGTETAAGAVPDGSKPGLQCGDLIEATHPARLDGNLGTVQSLEAQSPSATPLGESNGDIVVPQSSTPSGEGDLSGQAMMPKIFCGDIPVRGTDPTGEEISPAMATASNGDIYLAWEDSYHGENHYSALQVY